MDTKPRGLIVEPIQPEDYVLGGDQSLETKYGAEAINPEADWTRYTPSTEDQSTKNGDTFACVSFGTNNAVEMLARLRFGAVKNLSDRFLAKTSGTIVGQGNSPKRVADTLRHTWTVNETEWPDVDSVQDFYADIPENLRTLAVARGAEFEFGYQYITNSPSSIKTALKSSPVCIAVTAWKEENGVYVRSGTENHWVTIIKVLDNGNYQVFDSFPPFFKEVHPSACQSVAMSYYLNRQVQVESAWRKFLKLIKSLFTQPTASPTTPSVTPQEPPGEAQPPKPTPEPPPSDLRLIEALIQVESGGSDWAIGDRHLFNKAYGPLQIRKPVCDDINNALGTAYAPQRCLGDRTLSIKIFREYMKLWATEKKLGRPVTDQDRARIWNGGPTGWKRPSTALYWSKVKKLL